MDGDVASEERTGIRLLTRVLYGSVEVKVVVPVMNPSEK